MMHSLELVVMLYQWHWISCPSVVISFGFPLIHLTSDLAVIFTIANWPDLGLGSLWQVGHGLVFGLGLANCFISEYYKFTCRCLTNE